MARLHLLVRGHVQGIGFRATVFDRAAELGLKGWVRNNRDGSVECIAEGPADALEALRLLCRQGPPGARITSFDELSEPERGEFSAFHVQPTH